MKTPRISHLSVLAAGGLALAFAGCGGSSYSGSNSGSSSNSAAKTSTSSSSSSGGGYGYGASGASTKTTSSSSSSGSAVKLSADPNGGLKFTKTHLTAKAGTVSLVMSNPGSSGQGHGIGVEGKGIDKNGPVVGPGSVSKISVKLKPGTYEFYCPVPAHKMAGMKGTLVVQ